MSSDFCHLHLHTEYSMLDSLCRLDKLFEKAEEKGISTLAMTDHHNLSGAIKFYQLAQQSNIKPIIGVELNIESILDIESKSQYHLTALAKNNLGYTNLLKLITRSNLDNDGLVTREIFREYRQGLIVLSGCSNSEVDRLIEENPSKAREVVLQYRNILGQNNYYLELQRFGLPGEDERIDRKVELADKLNIPVVATGNTHYLDRDEGKSHLALTGIHQLSGKSSWAEKTTDEYYLKSPREMEVLFSDIPKAVENTVRIGERCNVYFDLEELHFPHFPLPDDYTAESYLRSLCQVGLKELYGESPGEEVLKRLEYELTTISQMGYAGYFLIMWDIVNYAREEGILTFGRGSAVSSLVCYLLKITSVDPLEYGLYFERFLNPERVSMPDIDLDIDHIGRKEILKYISDKYGHENMAHISAFSTLSSAAVVRDVARVQGWPEEKLTRLTRFIAHQNILNVDSPINNRDFKKAYYQHSAFAHLIDTAQELEGLPRHYTQHSAGVVISPDSLTNYTPLQYSSDGEVITQFDMRTIEDLGLLKIDLLGVRFLSAIRFTLQLLKKTKGIDYRVDEISLDDDSTYEMIRQGDTIGCFQLESGGCRKLLQQLKPQSLRDIMFATSLYRPGPIEGGMVQKFVARLNKEEEIEYPHPLLEDLLKDTYGVVIFQEQVMMIARKMGGFSLGEADILRKAIAKKDRILLAKQKIKFIEGAKERGVSAPDANYIFDKLHKFAGYGFCKAHAAAYAYIAYITAYLKRHYPVEYLTSLFNVNLHFDCRIRQYLNQARFRDINVLPPDINESQLLATTDGNQIRMGLLMVKGVGKRGGQEIVEKRKGNAYLSITDLCRRVNLSIVSSSMLEKLAKAGAFDSFGDRREQLWSIKKIHQESRDNQVCQGQLQFLPHQSKVQSFTGDIPEMELREVIDWEIESMGHPITDTPLSYLMPDSDQLSTINQLKDTKEDKVWICGEITAIRFRWTSQGKLVCFFTLEDLESTAEVTVFEPVVSRDKKLLYSKSMILVYARIERKGTIYDLLAEKIVPLSGERK